jgi:hypothetical protein
MGATLFGSGIPDRRRLLGRALNRRVAIVVVAGAD